MSNLFETLEKEGYYNLKNIPNKGICGLRRFLFTTGLCYGIDEYSHAVRYCYQTNADAVEAIEEWDGNGDPKDENWIKHKGTKEYSNPLNTEQY